MAEERLWPAEPTPANTNNADGGTAIALGTVFTVAEAGNILGAYIRVSDTPPGGTCRLLLYAGEAASVLANEVVTIGPGGWTRFDFADPIPVTADETYIVYYHQTAGGGQVRYTSTQNIFTGAVTSGNLTGLATAAAAAAGISVAGNGVFRVDNADPTVFPDASFNASAYWVDPIFEADAAPDETAPILSNATASATGQSTASLAVDTDEGNGTLFWVVTTSSSQPSGAQIAAGQDHTGSPAADSGSQAVSGTGTQNVAGGASGLVAATNYWAYFVQDDAAANRSNIVSDSFTTDSGADETAPVLSNAAAAATGPTTASLAVSTNEAGGTLYWVVTTSATPPSGARVVAGQDHAGAPAADSGSQAVIGSGTQTISGGAAGLTEATAFWAHFVQDDAASNRSNVATSPPFETETAGQSAEEWRRQPVKKAKRSSRRSAAPAPKPILPESVIVAAKAEKKTARRAAAEAEAKLQAENEDFEYWQKVAKRRVAAVVADKKPEAKAKSAPKIKPPAAVAVKTPAPAAQLVETDPSPAAAEPAPAQEVFRDATKNPSGEQVKVAPPTPSVGSAEVRTAAAPQRVELLADAVVDQATAPLADLARRLSERWAALFEEIGRCQTEITAFELQKADLARRAAADAVAVAALEAAASAAAAERDRVRAATHADAQAAAEAHAAEDAQRDAEAQERARAAAERRRAMEAKAEADEKAAAEAAARSTAAEAKIAAAKERRRAADAAAQAEMDAAAAAEARREAAKARRLAAKKEADSDTRRARKLETKARKRRPVETAAAPETAAKTAAKAPARPVAAAGRPQNAEPDDDAAVAALMQEAQAHERAMVMDLVKALSTLMPQAMPGNFQPVA
jgi:uncharacterized protein DUF4082